MSLSLVPAHYCGATDCARPVGAPEHTVCGACVALLEGALRDLADLAPELDVTIRRQDQTRRPGQTVVRSSPTRALPFNENAREAGADAWNALHGWVLVLLDPEQDTPPGTALAQLAVWLLARVDLLARHPDGGIALGDLVAARDLVRRVIGLPPDLAYAGPCSQCTADLYGRLDRATVTCRECATAHPTAGRREWLIGALRDHRATLTEIAQGIGELVGRKVTRAQLGMLKTRGRIVPEDPNTGELALGRGPVYEVGKVVDVLVDIAAKRTAGASS